MSKYEKNAGQYIPIWGLKVRCNYCQARPDKPCRHGTLSSFGITTMHRVRLRRAALEGYATEEELRPYITRKV